MSEQAPVTDSESPWEVSVACDIHLGEILNDPRCSQNFIDIDGDAIVEVLNRFSSESGNETPGGRILLVAARGDSQLLRHSGSENFGVTKDARDLGKEAGLDFLVAVSVSYSPLEEELSEMEIDEIFDSQFKSLNLKPKKPYDTKKITQEISAILPPFFIESDVQETVIQEISAILPPFFIESDVQETVIHELQHVADHTNAKFRREDRGFLAKTAVKMYSAYIVSAAAAFGATHEVISSINNQIPEMANAVGAAAVAYAVGERVSDCYATRLTNRFSQKRPAEIRAYAREEQAYDLPQIISFE